MVTKIAIAAGDIWLALDANEGISKDELFKRLESQERPRELLLMALGWLIYGKHVKWVPDNSGGKLFLVNSVAREEADYEKPNQNRLAFNNA